MMRTLRYKMLPALLIAGLLASIPFFTAIGAAMQTDEPTATPTVIAPDDQPALFEEDLGPATREITDDSEAAIRAALAEFEQRADVLPVIATLADGSAAIPVANPPAYLPVIIVPPARGSGDQPGQTPTPEPPPRAKITAVVWPQPSIRAGRGATIAYELRIYNDGRGDAGSTTVVLPYNRSHIIPIGSKLDRDAGDWVSELTTTKLTVTFGNLGNGKTRNGIIYFQVNGGLADNTIIDMRPEFEWSDKRGGGSGRSNWAPVLVGGGNDTAAYIWMIVDPSSGSAVTTRTFFTNRFVPGEGVVTWLNTPNGVQELDVGGTADPAGRVWLSYKPDDLKPGTYQLVAYGTRSRLTGVVSFVVR